jgi:hypothetical protein
MFAQVDNLPKSVKEYIIKKLDYFKKNDGLEFDDQEKLIKNGYAKYARQVLKGDLNNDGKPDIVLKMHIVYGGEGGFSAQYLIVFLYNGKDYKLVAEKEFSTTVHVEGYYSSLALKEIKNNKIVVTGYWVGKEDGQCCATLEEEFNFKLVNNTLISSIDFEKPKILDKIGNVIDVGYFEYRVDKIEFLKTIKNVFNSQTADGYYLIVYLTVLNTTHETQTLTATRFKVFDSEDYQYEPSQNAITTLVLNDQDKVFLLKDIPPKIPKNIIIPFEIPTMNDMYTLQISGGYSHNESEKILLKK